MKKRSSLFAVGDINAFFGLMLDNVTNLVIVAAILTGAFKFPQELVLSRMLPGSAMGVLVGDLLYSFMAWRLARKSGRTDVTAMPLGLDTPSTFGMTFGVIGPCYLATRDPHLTWQVGMATIILMGIFKIAVSFCGPAIRRAIPRAGLLGSIAAVALLLIAYLPFLKLFASPVVGFLSLGIVFISLLARFRLPLRLPGALAGILCGTVAYYVLGSIGLLPDGLHPALTPPSLALHLPLPSLEFLPGLGRALGYLPLAIPFALATVVGGVDVTESAAVAGDDYNTRDILLVEGFATLLAGMCGGVIQSCPYIGHPAYKEMGGRSGYTIATGLFIGIEITSQAFEATAKEHYRALAISFIPVIACLVSIEFGQLLAGVGKSAADLTGDLKATVTATTILGNGFIVTSLLWGAAFAYVLDHRPAKASVFLVICALFTLFGIMHSPLPSGALFSPLAPPSDIVWHLAAGYAAMAATFLVLHKMKKTGEQ
ncbi:hypothetical protein GMSM_44880 [Geomonas sp. Red276]